MKITVAQDWRLHAVFAYPWIIAGRWVFDMINGRTCWISNGYKYQLHWPNSWSKLSYWFVKRSPYSQDRKSIMITHNVIIDELNNKAMLGLGSDLNKKHKNRNQNCMKVTYLIHKNNNHVVNSTNSMWMQSNGIHKHASVKVKCPVIINAQMLLFWSIKLKNKWI